MRIVCMINWIIEYFENGQKYHHWPFLFDVKKIELCMKADIQTEMSR